MAGFNSNLVTFLASPIFLLANPWFFLGKRVQRPRRAKLDERLTLASTDMCIVKVAGGDMASWPRWSLKSQNMQEKAAINDIADMNERVLERGRIAPAQTIVFTAAGGLTTSKRR